MATYWTARVILYTLYTSVATLGSPICVFRLTVRGSFGKEEVSIVLSYFKILQQAPIDRVGEIGPGGLTLEVRGLL